MTQVNVFRLVVTSIILAGGWYILPSDGVSENLEMARVLLGTAYP